MNSSTELSWAPALDLSRNGLTRLDPARIEDAVHTGYADGFDAGRIDGYAEGLAAGRAAAVAEVDALRHDTAALLHELARLGENLAHSETVTADLFAARAADAAVRIARSVIGRELADESVAAVGAVDRVLLALGRRAEIRLQVHPDDAAILEAAGVPDNVVVEANPGLRRGDATGRTDDRTVDARIESALSRALDVLEGRA